MSKVPLTPIDRMHAAESLVRILAQCVWNIRCGHFSPEDGEWKGLADGALEDADKMTGTLYYDPKRK